MTSNKQFIIIYVPWYIGTMIDESKLLVERVQTGVRMEKRILKVLKAFAEYHDMSLGDLLEGIVLHAFDGKSPFGAASLQRIRDLQEVLRPRSRLRRQPSSDRGHGARHGRRLREDGKKEKASKVVNAALSAGLTDNQSCASRHLISEFEQGRGPGDFHHADHMRVAFAYVSELPVPEALARFSAALKRFALSKGKPNLYHETITWAYLFLIGERIARAGITQSWEEFAEKNQDLLVWKGGILERYYSKATLESDLARKRFVLPDLG